jgi:hypothetical protein
MSTIATGGTETEITIDGTKWYVHTFTSGGTLEVLSNIVTLEYLIVGAGGGGGGGNYHGAGGGAGGLLTNVGGTPVALPIGSYPVIVGSGGSGGTGTGLANNGLCSAIDPISLLLHADGPNNSTIFTDSSYYNNTFIVAGGAKISTAQSKFGGSSANFAANGDYIRSSGLPFQFRTNDFTIETWIYLSSLPASGKYFTVIDNLIHGGVGARNDAFVLLINSSGQLNIFSQGTFRTASTSAISIGSWVHIALTRTSSTIRYFINGSLDASTYTLSTDCSSGGAEIGTISDGAGHPDYQLIGYLDDFRITKGISRYTASFTVPSAAFTNPSLTIISEGGGAGGRQGINGSTGGSGGGSGYSASGEVGTAGQGNAGASGVSPGAYGSGGGGGAGTAGSIGTTSVGGNGGNGLQININGTPTYYAGGGGGSAYDGVPGSGGLGGGGTGARGTAAPNNATSGTANTGGGGGGAERAGTTTGGSGGSGIIIVRYPEEGAKLFHDFNIDYLSKGLIVPHQFAVPVGAGVKPGVLTWPRSLEQEAVGIATIPFTKRGDRD